jgi:hypothetical protein
LNAHDGDGIVALDPLSIACRGALIGPPTRAAERIERKPRREGRDVDEELGHGKRAQQKHDPSCNGTVFDLSTATIGPSETPKESCSCEGGFLRLNESSTTFAANLGIEGALSLDGITRPKRDEEA